LTEAAEKKVRRGRVEIEARIDLHGHHHQTKARSQLLGFLRRARENGFRQVLVITGKGAGTRAIDQRRFEPWTPEERALPGVLRRSFTQWMDDPVFASLVSGYAESHRRHGGSGAFYVMLRQ
jgi:DNA-nicking Smr family endonuclease